MIWPSRQEGARGGVCGYIWRRRESRGKGRRAGVRKKRKDVRWMEHIFFDGVQSVDDISPTLKIQDKVQHELY